MALDKKAFNNAIHQAIAHPKNELYQTQAIKQIETLAKVVIGEKQYKFTPDLLQDAVIQCWVKMANIKKESGTPFNFFWTILQNQMLKYIDREQRWSKKHMCVGEIGKPTDKENGSINTFDTPRVGGISRTDIEDSVITLIQYNIMRELGIEPQQKDIDFDPPSVPNKPLGRSEVLRSNNADVKYVIIGQKGFTKYLVDIYDHLKREGKISVSEAAAYVPATKNIKDLRKYLYIKMYEIAKRSGDKVKLDGDTFYVVSNYNGNR